MAVCVGLHGQGPAKPSPDVKRQAVIDAMLTEDQKVALGKRLLLDEEPFTTSLHARYPQTMNLFFRPGDYALLRGNPYVGYTAIQGFQWPKGAKEIAFLGMRNAPRAAALTAAAWEEAFRAAAKGHGLVVTQKAPVAFEGACVSLTQDLDQNLIGLVVEARIKGPAGVFLYRAQFAGKRLGEAMTGVMDWILGYAKGLGDEEGARTLLQQLKAKAAAGAEGAPRKGR